MRSFASRQRAVATCVPGRRGPRLFRCAGVMCLRYVETAAGLPAVWLCSGFIKHAMTATPLACIKGQTTSDAAFGAPEAARGEIAPGCRGPPRVRCAGVMFEGLWEPPRVYTLVAQPWVHQTHDGSKPTHMPDTNDKLGDALLRAGGPLFMLTHQRSFEPSGSRAQCMRVRLWSASCFHDALVSESAVALFQYTAAEKKKVAARR